MKTFKPLPYKFSYKIREKVVKRGLDNRPSKICYFYPYDNINSYKYLYVEDKKIVYFYDGNDDNTNSFLIPGIIVGNPQTIEEAKEVIHYNDKRNENV
jgi:hypothetical protein